MGKAFHYRNVKELYPMFWLKTQQLTLAIANSNLACSIDNRRVVEVSGWLSRTALDCVGLGGLGQSFNVIADPSTPLYKHYDSLLGRLKPIPLVMVLLYLILPFWLLRLLPLKRNEEINEDLGVIRGACSNMIRAKKTARAKGKPPGKDILDLALYAFPEEKLIDQLMTFLGAGIETTASATTWAILRLCQHPHVQRRLREELCKAKLDVTLKEVGSSIEARDIDNLPYLSAVCNEVLRLHPPVPFIVRTAV